jgi:predicted Fe-S protein YdhL (DUF1289 family)
MFWPTLTFPPINLWSIWPLKDELSPCTRKCIYNAQAGICVSCGRDSVDLRCWSSYNDTTRRERILKAQKRLKEMMENR